MYAIRSYYAGTTGHYDRANARPGKDALRVSPGDAQFMAKFDAKSGTASFNSSAFTCSDVSCHGGITTPSWRTGTIDVNVNDGCLQCHALGTALGNPENNSPFSGLHNKHLNGLGANGNRITSYNVCYTKLLRPAVGQDHHGRPPQVQLRGHAGRNNFV